MAIFLGIAGYWYSSKNLYSKDILKLEILGPSETGIGEEIEYLVKYKNNSDDIRLDNPKLIFEYPSLAILEEGKSLRQEMGKEQLGESIYPGEEKTIHFKCRLLGKENEAKEAKASLSYQPKNLNAQYESKTTLTTIIKNVPITFSFDDLPSTIKSGKDVNFIISYSSYADFPLSNLSIKIEYPAGFEFKKSEPKALEQKEWDIGSLNKSDKGRIKIAGVISGGLKEQKIFKAQLGSWQDGEFILLKEIYKGVEIVEPDLRITQQINGSSQSTANAGDLLHYEIFFQNLGQQSLENLFLIVELEGQMFDLESIKTTSGDYALGDDSIIFDSKKNPDLKFLDAQKEGRVEFWVELKKDFTISDIDKDKNPIVKDKIILSQAREEFEIKINSKLEFLQRGLFFDEAFGNSGPLPPEVGQQTTYTVTWYVKNHYDQLNNAKIRTILPSGVELTGKIFPEDQSQKFTFDSQSREIVWDIGDLEPGRGVLNSAPNMTFQIALTPNSSQRGNPALLINKAEFSGEDQWTGQTLRIVASSTDTTLPDDPNMSSEKGIVK
ncbi:MAG: hypothetical protein NTU58_02510 [Candidatus Nealsonbacteria bacterium]|nr:hypothetical protein [Candidatus Nealsonbacteria bacterium]